MSNAYIHLDSIDTLEQYRHKLQDWKEKILACINTKYNNTYISNQLLLQFDVNTVGDFFNTVYKSI